MALPGEAVIATALSFGGKILDKIFPDPNEKAKAQALLQRAQDAGALQDLDAGIRQEQERTARHANDMKSDSWLSKNIRPGMLIYLLAIFTVLALSDGNVYWTFREVVEGKITEVVKSFSIKSIYVTGFTDLLQMAAGFYFVGRSIEKGMALFKGAKA